MSPGGDKPSSKLSEHKNSERVEPVVMLLFWAMLAMLAALFVCEFCFRTDGQMFQVVAGLLASISGAFLMRVKPRDSTSSAAAKPTAEPLDNSSQK